MKAMILAAGFGTRLRPYTEWTPKPLFTIAGRPVLDIMIDRLLAAGCRAIVINTHHQHRQIASFLEKQQYPVPVTARHEPQILGTGGAIKNVSDFWDTDPLLVINSDIVTDIDLAQVYQYHRRHRYPVTLVLHDDPRYNCVSVNRNGFIRAFSPKEPGYKNSGHQILAFTGIQVLNPEVLEYIPGQTFYSSIDAYRQMIADGRKIKASVVRGHYWQDIGTPQSYRQTVYENMSAAAFNVVDKKFRNRKITRVALAGDGSDRKWYRLSAGKSTLVMVDHGIRQNQQTAEAEAFVAIGRHLEAAGVRVPTIYLYDTFAGLVFMQDLGDLNLQQIISDTAKPGDVITCYQSVIRQLLQMSVAGANNFNPAWTWQTPSYSRELILEKECRYFVEAFLQTYLGLKVRYSDLAQEFALLADRALENAANGFMHRDMQSRNIMVNGGKTYFIDFQGGRTGPLQYDLASLLIDPYVDLPDALRSKLFDYAAHNLPPEFGISRRQFRKGCIYCALTRNLQILGAFGHLSQNRGKRYFEKYIPAALRTLEKTLSDVVGGEFPQLKKTVAKIAQTI
jgi:aminoglycoside/choline kinase family phosphotransferase/GTP:adenosylcobinamide-phosphate guanylyltransferase